MVVVYEKRSNVWCLIDLNDLLRKIKKEHGILFKVRANRKTYFIKYERSMCFFDCTNEKMETKFLVEKDLIKTLSGLYHLDVNTVSALVKRNKHLEEICLIFGQIINDLIRFRWWGIMRNARQALKKFESI